MKKGLKVAIAQLKYETGNKEKALEKAEKVIKEASEKGSEMIIFPEIYYQGYCNSIEKFKEIAETNDGELSEWLSKKAKEYNIYIVMGYCQKKLEQPEKLFNTVIMYNNTGKFIGDYVKVYGWGDENLVFTPGEKLPVYDTEFGKIGFAICYDIEFPEVFRIMAMKKVDIVIVISAWSKHLEVRWHAGLLAGATQNLITVIACNSVGLNPANLPLAGDSKIISPFGRILANANDIGEEEILYCSLNVKEIQKERENYPIWRDYRRDMFNEELLKKY